MGWVQRKALSSVTWRGADKGKYCERHSTSFSRTWYELHVIREKSNLLVVSCTNMAITDLSSVINLMTLSVDEGLSIESAIDGCA